ncbi:MAG: hypothetical protein IT339_00595 [Thermomicrobiales bacterium]|nr:hypothetical protein [Thermomicrobiales bacterium]
MLGATGVTLYYLLQNLGIRSVSAGRSTLVLYAGSILFTVLFGRLLLGERCCRLTAIAIGLTAFGLGAIVFDMQDGIGSGLQGAGMCWLLAASVAFAIFTIIGRTTLARDLLSLEVGMLLVGFVLMIPFAMREQQPSWADITERAN